MSTKLQAIKPQPGRRTAAHQHAVAGLGATDMRDPRHPLTLPQRDRIALQYLLDLVSLWRRIILSTVAGALVLAVLFLLVSPSRYTAKALVLFDTNANAVGQVGVSAVQSSDTPVILSQIELLRAPSLAQEVLRSDAITEGERNGGPVASDIVPASGGVRQEETEEFLDNLAAIRRDQSYVVELSYTDTDPSRAARLLNSLVAQYMSSTIENSAATVTAVTQDVDARLNAAKSVTADIQAKLRRFKIEHGLMERDTTTGVERPSAEKAAATGAIATRAQLLASEARLQANSGYGDLDEPLEIFGSSVRSEKLANYRRDLGALNRQESDRGQFETTDASVAQKSQVLRRLIADEIGRLVDIERERIVVTLIDLERQEKAALDLQSSLQTQIKDIQLAGAVPSVRARIIEAAATPKKRSSPRATLILPLAVLGGLAAGLALALIKESLRQDLRSLRDIWSTLGEVPVTVLPSLALSPDPIAPIMDEEPHAAGNGVLAKAGTLPERLHKQRSAGEAAQSVRLAATGGTSGPLRSKFYRAIANYPGIVNAPQYRNALLALKQAIDRSTRKKPSKVIAVVSGLAGEGKSTTALNLALLAAESGAETLLIDLDVRGADLTREFTLQTSAIISEASEDELDDTVAPLQSGLSFLAARRAGENETLRSISAARLAALISKMRVNFDLVIVDTPGILEYPDAEMALSEVDVAILVTRFGTTLRGDVRATMSQILAAGGRDVEVVLNDCDVGNSSESISSAMRRFPFGL